MTVTALAGQIGDRTIGFSLGVAEVGAMVVTGVVMTVLLIVSQVVRVTMESAENARTRRTKKRGPLATAEGVRRSHLGSAPGSPSITGAA